MDKYLYEVELEGGSSNRNYEHFLVNANNLYGRPTDFGGIKNLCLVAHSQDAETVQLLMSYGFKGNRTDVTVTEITRESLEDENSHHRIYTDTVEYFQRSNTFPNID